MNEYLLTINDNKSINGYAKMIDVFRPKEAQYIYISINKFQASVPTIFNSIPNNVVVSIDGTQNTLSNEPKSNNVVPSPIVDSFVTTTFIQSGSSYFAVYNVENKHDNWLKINSSSLSNMILSFKTCSNYIDLVNDIRYVNLPAFGFSIQLKLKFE